MTTFLLNTGQYIPAIGLGTWRSAPGNVAQAVQYALENGCRHIDAALRYGNEHEVGRGIRASGVPRQDIFLTTKLWNTYHDRVEEGVTESLKNLGTHKLLLREAHAGNFGVADNSLFRPVSLPANASNTVQDNVLEDWDYVQTWAEMQKLVKRGLVRAIGVSNFTPKHLERLLSAPSTTIIPAVNQVELHPLNPQPELFAYCSQRSIHLTAYSPLGSQDSPLYSIRGLQLIAEKLNKSVAQVLLAWGIRKGWSVVPKSVSSTRILENLAGDFYLSEGDLATIDNIKERRRLIDGQDFLPIRIFD